MLLSEENINDIGHIYNSIYHNGINEETQVFVEQLSDEELLNLYTEHVINEVITEMCNQGLLNEGIQGVIGRIGKEALRALLYGGGTAATIFSQMPEGQKLWDRITNAAAAATGAAERSWNTPPTKTPPKPAPKPSIEGL